jgi:hypothetical protein
MRSRSTRPNFSVAVPSTDTAGSLTHEAPVGRSSGTQATAVGTLNHDESEPFLHVASLGLLCMTARLIERAGLRTYALPFDWIASTPRTIMHCLDDRFRDLLDKKNYVPLESEYGWKNTIFENLYGIGKTFGHHDIHSAVEYRHIEMSVERFLALLESRERKMFVITHDDFSHPHFADLFDAIMKKTANARIVAIETKSCSAPPDRRRAEMVGSAGTTDFYELWTSSEPNGECFADDEDNALFFSILRNYNFRLAATPLKA